MAQVEANGIAIEYDEHGDPAHPVILLIMGFGAQMILWPEEFVAALVGHGFRVIRYDNRDIGLSHKFDGVAPPAMWKTALLARFGFSPKVPYTLGDMADDGAGLLDALGIGSAHVVGASMGGMIAQHFAARHPGKTRSLTSIMSTTGNPALRGASLQAMGILLRRPRGNDLEAIVAHGVKAAKVVGGSYPEDDLLMAERYRDEIVRNHHPSGFVRQMAAILADGDRRTRLHAITAPAVVVHGADDPLVPAEGGRDTAAAIPGARLVEIPGMGHTLPPEVIPTVIAAFESVARPKLARAA